MEAIAGGVRAGRDGRRRGGNACVSRLEGQVGAGQQRQRQVERPNGTEGRAVGRGTSLTELQPPLVCGVATRVLAVARRLGVRRALDDEL